MIQSNSTDIKIESAPALGPNFLDSSFPVLGAVQKPSTSRAVLSSALPEVLKNVAEQENPSRKKRPEKNLTVNLEYLLQKRTKKVVVSKKKKFKVKSAYFEEKLSGNPLDSSQPIRHKGKVREIPKKKRKTSLKIAIVAYRYISIKILHNILFTKTIPLEN